MNAIVGAPLANGRAGNGQRRSADPPGFALFIVLVVFTLLSVPSRWPALGIVRPTLLIVVVVAIQIIVHGGSPQQADASRTTRRLNLLIGYILLTIPFVEWPGSVVRFGVENLLKVVVFFYFAAYLVDSFRRMRILIGAFVTCQVIRVLEPLYLHVTTGYWGDAASVGDGEFLARLSGAPSDIINPNGLAFVVLSVLPFLHYLLWGSGRKLYRLLYVILLPAVLYAFMLTGSRSGLVGLVVLVGFMVWRSPHRVTAILAAAVASVAMVSVMDAGMRERYLSLAETGTKHDVTRQGRIEGVEKDVQLGMRRPLFGHGLGTSVEALTHFRGRAQISHNLYTEAFIELGIVGLVLYLRVLLSILSNVRAVGPALKELARESLAGPIMMRPEDVAYAGNLAEAVYAWVVMCLVFSLASYGLSEFYWYMVAGISVALRNVVSMDITTPTPGNLRIRARRVIGAVGGGR